MTTKTETLLRTRIIKRLQKERPGFWMVVHGSAMQQAGVPDLIGCYRGRFVGLEVKVPGEEPDPLQSHRLNQIIRAGGIAGVIESPDDALRLVPA